MTQNGKFHCFHEIKIIGHAVSIYMCTQLYGIFFRFRFGQSCFRHWALLFPNTSNSLTDLIFLRFFIYSLSLHHSSVTGFSRLLSYTLALRSDYVVSNAPTYLVNQLFLKVQYVELASPIRLFDNIAYSQCVI